jgi:copper oxidase (laccase) domain-containing protein
MAFSERQNFIINVHAGWRGIENQISIKAVNQLIENSIDVSQLKFFIGPHIKQESFEVDLDVRNKLYDSIPARMRTEQMLAKTFEVKGAKHHIDLSLIMEQQLHSVGVNQSQISKSSIDTFTSTEFHSHRREREKAGRQLSLICLK